MKLTLFLSLFILNACQELNIKVGECIQRPDSMEILKVEEVNEQIATVTIVSPPSEDNTQRKLELSSQWIVTSCPTQLKQ